MSICQSAESAAERYEHITRLVRCVDNRLSKYYIYSDGGAARSLAK